MHTLPSWVSCPINLSTWALWMMSSFNGDKRTTWIVELTQCGLVTSYGDTGSTLAQVMDDLLLEVTRWFSPESNFTDSVNSKDEFQNYTFDINSTYARGQRVKNECETYTVYTLFYNQPKGSHCRFYNYTWSRDCNKSSDQRQLSLLWASCQIRKIVGCACAGNVGNVFSRHRLQRKPLVSDPGMHHGTCAAHVPWRMPGLLTPGGGENVSGIPDACASRNVSYLARGPWNYLSKRTDQYFLGISSCTLWHHSVSKSRIGCTRYVTGPPSIIKWAFKRDSITNVKPPCHGDTFGIIGSGN